MRIRTWAVLLAFVGVLDALAGGGPVSAVGTILMVYGILILIQLAASQEAREGLKRAFLCGFLDLHAGPIECAAGFAMIDCRRCDGVQLIGTPEDTAELYEEEGLEPPERLQ